MCCNVRASGLRVGGFGFGYWETVSLSLRLGWYNGYQYKILVHVDNDTRSIGPECPHLGSFSVLFCGDGFWYTGIRRFGRCMVFLPLSSPTPSMTSPLGRILAFLPSPSKDAANSYLI